jgi:recombinational DNA repair ATPase RecF
MLELLDLRHVGPAPEMQLELKPRMNFLAGDNGLGKSFLLDVAWWALTRTCRPPGKRSWFPAA